MKQGLPRHVLVIDDDAGFRAFARELLEAGGFRVVDVPDGAAALAKPFEADELLAACAASCAGTARTLPSPR